MIDRCLSYRNDIYNFAYRMTYDAALSEDIAQETLLAAVKGIDGFSGRSELKTWLIAIAKNEAYKAIRGRKRDLKRLMELRAAENAAAHIHDLSSYEQDASIEQIKNGCLFALLTCLPFNQRAAFILHVLNEVPMRTTAEVLGKSENAARILVSRAKATIKRFLCAHCEYLEGAARCRCLNMLNFSLKRGLIAKLEDGGRTAAAKAELRRFRDEIALLKTLPAMEWRRRIELDSAYGLIFPPKK